MKIIVDTPKWGFIKKKDDGSIDYISPFPCPFNYGSILDTEGEDGDREDIVVLGKKLKSGTQDCLANRVAIVSFYDKGEFDPKHIYSDKELNTIDKLKLYSFFSLFSVLKLVLNAVKGKKGKTKFVGIKIIKSKI